MLKIGDAIKIETKAVLFHQTTHYLLKINPVPSLLFGYIAAQNTEREF